MTDYETILGISVVIFLWVMVPISYYLGFRDGNKRGFRRGLPMGALAWVITTLDKELEAVRPDTGENDDRDSS